LMKEEVNSCTELPLFGLFSLTAEV